MILNFTFFAISILVLVFSGSIIVRYLTRIAAFFKLSGFVAAFVLMAFSTSLPELFLSISSAFQGDSKLALGTIIGSNIADVSLVIGIVVVLSRGIRVGSKTIRRESLYVFLMVLLLSVLLFFGNGLSRFDGFILLVVFGWYVYFLFKKGRKFSQIAFENNKKKDIIFSLMVFFGGILALLLSSHYVVHFGELIAVGIGVPTILIGLFLIGFGSSLPELVFQIRAARSKNEEMSLGDALGSVVANSTLILGITALIQPITFEASSFMIGVFFMVMMMLLLVFMLHQKKRLSVFEGLVLVLLYVLFLITELFVQFL